ncbi:uncharacterized protein N7482_002421 [Penicillium canariense]|uniref:Uncharacterized protein n=1 Tax=Penicillium canariense TaxID=189055 RepID=A0A9W9IFB6_9EURO|nr:uncharacterized protein N7482_002421 [Penicillium canariense]KAJ5176544.1 hypothetical protein N7482_002421 [Penicillium canariense]
MRRTWQTPFNSASILIPRQPPEVSRSEWATNRELINREHAMPSHYFRARRMAIQTVFQARVYSSKVTAEMVVQHHRLKMTELQSLVYFLVLLAFTLAASNLISNLQITKYEVYLVVIQNRGWDPLQGPLPHFSVTVPIFSKQQAASFLRSYVEFRRMSRSQSGPVSPESPRSRSASMTLTMEEFSMNSMDSTKSSKLKTTGMSIGVSEDSGQGSQL